MICFFRNVFLRAIYATISETSKNLIKRNIFCDFEKAATKIIYLKYKGDKFLTKNYSTLYM